MSIVTTHVNQNNDPARRLIESIEAGTGIPTDLFAPDAILDATVPLWRYETTGGEAIGRELGRWYKDPATIDKVVRRPIPGGVALELDFSWEDGGVPHAAHQLHLLTIDGGAIAADTVFCGGRWNAELLAEMEAARAH